MTKFVLASQSPRRIQLLTEIGLNFVVDPADFVEKDEHEDPRELVLHNAIGKAKEVAKRHPGAVIIAADTVGVAGGEILGKPRDYQHAYELIQKISGTTHQVVTGLCIADLRNKDADDDGAFFSSPVVTEVTMSLMDDVQIRGYLACNEWQDKAAAYAIQGKGALFIEKINGDYFNVVGLPLCELGRAMGVIGIDLLALN